MWGLGVLFALALTTASASAPVAVRYVETIIHAFLTLRGTNGDVLAYGELVQAPIKGQRMQSRLVFRFKDGSLYDEQVVFTQKNVFTLLSYRLVTKGPSFPEPSDVSLDRKKGTYLVKSMLRDNEPLQHPASGVMYAYFSLTRSAGL